MEQEAPEDLMIGERLSHSHSRRCFLASAAAFALVRSARSAGQGKIGGSTLAYLGTNTGGMGANGEGIYIVAMDRLTGALSQPKLAAKTPSPSWISIHPSKRFLYAVNEVDNYRGQSGSVSAFAIDSVNGTLSATNVVSSAGAGPAYLSIDASGRYAFVANYGGGSIAVLPILRDGSLAEAIDVHRDSLALGGTRAMDAPAGSFAISGHDAPHAHMIAADLPNRFVLATDLGQDRIYVYRLDLATGKLSPAETGAFFATPSGDGPRHFVFHPSGRWLYTIQEESSTVMVFGYTAESGSLTLKQTLSILPHGFAGSSFASEILVSPDGRFLYAANRLHDTIAILATAADGTLKLLGEVSTMGDYPSQCRIDPSGRFLYACNRRSDNITSFHVDRRTGGLQFTGQYTAVGSPASITFL